MGTPEGKVIFREDTISDIEIKWFFQNEFSFGLFICVGTAIEMY